MSLINPLSRELSAKIVYYGPGLSGKTTSLQHIHKAVRPERRGDLVSLATETDRTIFFDFLPLHVERVRGLSVRFQLYTVPGQVFYAATRKLVLSGADGVVFVADSQPSCRDANLESFEGMRMNLAELGIDLAEFPIVFQYNKRDLANPIPIDEMNAMLNFVDAPEHGTVANTGEGVLDALRDISKLVIRELSDQQPAVRRQIVEDGAQGRGNDGPDEGIAGQVRSAARAASDSQLAASRRHPGIVASMAPATVPSLAPLGLSPVAMLSKPPEGPILSFAELFQDSRRDAVGHIEQCIREGHHAVAVQLSAALVAEILDALPGASDEGGTGIRGALLGLDGREYLRLCRLEAAPAEALTRADALFALYLLVSTGIKSQGL